MADIVKNTKEQERAELHKSIWRIAEDLRGMVDGWDFKTYVLGTLFYRYISENIAKYIDDLQAQAGVEIGANDSIFKNADSVCFCYMMNFSNIWYYL